jgi:hypothetical protein
VKAYNADRNNIAPSIGVNWTPTPEAGWRRMLLGASGESSISGGYSRAFDRRGMSDFTGQIDNNPGLLINANRNVGKANLTIPTLLREGAAALGPPAVCPPLPAPKPAGCMLAAPEYPLTNPDATGSVTMFDPNLQVPYSDSWTIGFQRALGRTTAIEIRYVGTRSRQKWETFNYNEANILENGFLDEFKLAQANLLANVRAGRGATFAYMGPGTGTNPLPIFLSHFQGPNAGPATSAASYTSSEFGNDDWYDNLDPRNPDPFSIADDLYSGNSGVWRNNALGAGFPLNFWVMNPLVDEAEIMTNQGGSKYHSVQFDLRRRYAQGFQIQGSYTFARGYTLTNFDMHFDPKWRRNTSLPHKFALLWVWELPVGRGKRFGTDMNPWLDGVLGGWQFSGGGRIQLPLLRLTNTRLVGMSHAEAQKLLGDVRIDVNPITGATTVWNMPVDVIENTRKAYSTDPSHPSGYAGGDLPTGRYFERASSEGCLALFFEDCAPDMFFYGRWFSNFDFKFVKRFPVKGRSYFDLNVEVYNAFKAYNFNDVLNPGTDANIFRITGTQSGARRGQLVFRFSF